MLVRSRVRYRVRSWLEVGSEVGSEVGQKSGQMSSQKLVRSRICSPKSEVQGQRSQVYGRSQRSGQKVRSEVVDM